MFKVQNLSAHHTVNIRENESIFDGFSRDNQHLPHGCLSGSCGSCVIEIIDGAEQLTPPGIIEQNTLQAIKEAHPQLMDKNLRLSCRAKVQGAVTFQLIKI